MKYLEAYKVIGINKESGKHLWDIQVKPADYMLLASRMKHLWDTHEGIIPLINTLHPNCELRRVMMLYFYKRGVEDGKNHTQSYYKFIRK